jgi:hypothetical protein
MSRATKSFAMLSLAFLAVAAAGCSGIRYNNDFDPQVDFSRFSTFAWVEDIHSDAAQSRGLDPLDERRVKAALEEQLESRGYRKVTSGQPDFLLNFHTTSQEKIDVSTYYTGWGYYGWYGGTQTSVRQWTEGTLIIDFIDTAEKDLAWRGWATGAVDSFDRMSAEQKTVEVNKIVAGILEQFPPGS